MALGVLFFVLGNLLALGAVHWGGLAWLLAWPAANFLIVAAGYVAIGARLLGKRPDGTIALWSRLFFAPYFLVMRAAWHVPAQRC